jgi:hypothetical protein
MRLGTRVKEAQQAGGDPVATPDPTETFSKFTRSGDSRIIQGVRLVAGVGFVQERTNWELRKVV